MPGWDIRRVVLERAAAALERARLFALVLSGVVLVTLVGLPALNWFFTNSWIAPEHFFIALCLLCLVPAAVGHAIAVLYGRRGSVWLTVWLPGIAAYTALPWPDSEGVWRPLWIFGYAVNWAKTIFLDWNAAGSVHFNGFMTFVVMMPVAFVVCLKLVHGMTKAITRLGPAAIAAATTRDELPSADWASCREVGEWFSAEGGIVLGELTDPRKDSRRFKPDRPRSWGRQGRGRLITMDPTDGNGHVLVISQASGYKSTGLVIPNILTYRQGPIVVFDPKCELYARTRKAREAMGFKPVVIDENNGFDPARLFTALAVNHPSVYSRMANLMIPRDYGRGENGKFFKDAAINLFIALLGFYGERRSPTVIQDIAGLLGGSSDKVFEEVSERLKDTRLPFVRNSLSALEGMDERFWNSIRTEISNHLSFGTIPDIARYIEMKSGSELPTQVVDPRCDVFLNIPQHVAEDYAPMLRLMLGSMLTAAEFTEINEAPSARRLFLIDEAAKLGNMDILENIRDRGRSRGLHLMMIYQTFGDVERIWGRHGMTSWQDGCSATIVGPVASPSIADDISAMIGTRTVRVRTKGTSSSSQVLSLVRGSVGTTKHEQLREVRLIHPTQISQLPTHASIITATGRKPILASKAIWFTRADMKDRVRSTKEIRAELAVGRSQDAMLKRVADLTQPDGEENGPADPATGPKASADGDSPAPVPGTEANGGDPRTAPGARVANSGINPTEAGTEDGPGPQRPTVRPGPATAGADTVEGAPPVAESGLDDGGWTSKERELFVCMIQEGMSFAEIAAALGRSPAEVEAWSEVQRARKPLPRRREDGDGKPGQDEPEGGVAKERVRREAGTGGPAGHRRGAQDDVVPQAPGMANAAPADRGREVGTMNVRPERSPPNSVPGTGECDPDSP